MLRYLFVLRCSVKFRCEFLCLQRACYVVYEIINVYNDMGMTGITRRGSFYEDIFSVSIIQNVYKSYRVSFFGGEVEMHSLM